MGKIQFGDHVKSIFSIFLLAFYQNYHKTFFRGLFSSKEKMKKVLPTKPLSKLIFLQFRKACFVSRISPNTISRPILPKYKEEISNFCPKSWTAPLEKSNLVTIKNRYFYTTARLVSYSKLPQTLFLGHFCPKTRKKKILI